MTESMYGWHNREINIGTDKILSRNESKPRISVVVPTLNQGETIESTILSIINQDYTDFELIIMDGGSRDGTMDILRKYSRWIDYQVSANDGGQSSAINSGFRKATGNIYAWINSDDYYMPGAFSKVVDTFKSYPHVDIVVGGGDIVTRDNQFLKHIDPLAMTRENLLKWKDGEYVMQQSCFWSSSLWKKCGGVDENLNLLMDFDLWLRFSELGTCVTLNDVIGVMRYYKEAKTVSLRTNVKEELGYVYAKNGAYSEVRDLIRELIRSNEDLYRVLELHNKKFVNRVMKRLNISS